VTQQKRNDLIVIGGLILGATLGIGGTLVSSDSLRQIVWLIDGTGVVVATSLLAVRFFRRGDDIAAAGFLVFALGESLLVGGTAAGLDASVPSFGGGVALWSAGLLLLVLSQSLPIWLRVVHIVAAFLFAIVAFRIASGEDLVPTSSPLPFFAYPFVVLGFVGWIAAILTGPPKGGHSVVAGVSPHATGRRDESS
jgi:hypothetical protein